MWALAFIDDDSCDICDNDIDEYFAIAFLSVETIAIYVSWALFLWIIVAFIVGGVIKEDGTNTLTDLGFNILYGLVYTVFMVGFEMLGIYAFQPKALEFYDY